jgi:predicted outer membrane protein
VKKFRAQTVNGQKKVLPEAEQLASRQSVPLPTNLTLEDKQKVDEVSQLTGHVFDRANMNLALQNHEARLEEFCHHVNTLKYPDLREYFIVTPTDVTCPSVILKGETRWSTIRSH